jgi:hypothetical protein
LCALALALQGIAMLVVDLPGCIEIGGAAPSSHVHVADEPGRIAVTSRRASLARPEPPHAPSLFRVP